MMLGSNADGSDKLLPTGKAEKPRCFAGIRQFSCTYTNQQNAWMTGKEYTSWVRKFDARMRIEKRKVLLFVDNCPAHPIVDGLTNTEEVDMGIIKNFKHHNRTRLVQPSALSIL
ncbi:tigger transposable element-derived protein 4-like [Thrips palmi]|uniref:Tigger transposable element-derived protein 4-like n=1 Tax=Thrips palmi TaxID=161013 RepID=A0A6P9A7F9_THRPL|nr:tigger transposable element-derived protein 4-like [Thrips palmi]